MSEVDELFLCDFCKHIESFFFFFAPSGKILIGENYLVI